VITSLIVLPKKIRVLNQYGQIAKNALRSHFEDHFAGVLNHKYSKAKFISVSAPHKAIARLTMKLLFGRVAQGTYIPLDQDLCRTSFFKVDASREWLRVSPVSSLGARIASISTIEFNF